MKLVKLDENVVYQDVRMVNKAVVDNAALTWDQSEMITNYDKDMEKHKKELSPLKKVAKELVDQTAEGEKIPENIVNEEMNFNEDMEILQPRYDSAKSFYGKAKTEQDGDCITLYSYGTPVCQICNDEVELLRLWNCSQTTLRHVKEFLRQMGFRADSTKQMIHDYIDKQPNMVELESLKEDVDEEIPDETIRKDGLISVLNSLIREEWDTIDHYKSALIDVESYATDKSEDLKAILNDIMTEEMVHVGQLEKAMHLLDPVVASIEDGREEAEEEIDAEEETEEAEEAPEIEEVEEKETITLEEPKD